MLLVDIWYLLNEWMLEIDFASNIISKVFKETVNSLWIYIILVSNETGLGIFMNFILSRKNILKQ